MSFRARPPSPTNTAFSGVSNYRSESYRTLRDPQRPNGSMGGAGAEPLPQTDGQKIAKVHFDELQAFLSTHIAKEAPNSRASAREKLTRLTRQQFQELSTDVYDELIRRNAKSETPHLPTRDDFHPKRNQARQKLSTLPKARFKDLASDVYFELGRRYPEFKEPEIQPDTPESNYDDYGGEKAVSGRPVPQDGYRTRSPDNSNNMSNGIGRLGQARADLGPARRTTPDQTYGRRSEDNRPFGRQPSQASRNGAGNDDGESTYSASRRRPSNGSEAQYARKMPDSVPPGPSTATSGMVIPNKSTIAEEEIQVPYGRDSRAPRESDIRDSVASDLSADIKLDDTPPPPMQRKGSGGNNLAASTAGLDESKWGSSPVTPLQGGLSALAAGLGKNRNRSPPSDEDDRTDFFDTSTVGGRARSGSGGSNTARRPTFGGVDREETEKMRKDYEYRITNLQSKVGTLQDELDRVNKERQSDKERIRELTDEIASMRSKSGDTSSALRDMERRLADERSERERAERQMVEAHSQELRKLQQRCDELERDKGSASAFGDSAGIIEDLKAGMESLLEEVNELATRNDQLNSAKDEDAAMIQQLEEQVADYKKKYEKAKTELRGLKATSQLFLQRPRNEDQLPTSRTGAIQDVHITAFQSAADELLSAGRSDAPSRVLTPMKAVVDAVSAIIEDARAYDLAQRSKDDTPIDYATIDNLCERTQATLSNLVTASKTHATSYGLSPVSLLDAALSHVSASVTELAKLLLVRRSPRETDGASTNGMSNGRYGNNLTVGNAPKLVRIEEPMSPDYSEPPSAGRGDWAEVKPYLEAQSEQLVQSIQAILNAVRNPSPSVELNDNVTQIITIVSSIVAVSRDSLPQSSYSRGLTILNTLSEHCNKLSETQSERTISKDGRQVLAQSSFAIASAVKELMKL